MKRWVRIFAGAFFVTAILVSVLGALYYCEQNAQAVMADESSQLFAVVIADNSNTVSLTMLGEQYRLDCTPLASAEEVRRRCYYLLPMSVKLMEQAVCHTVNELNALATRAAG